MSATVTIEYDDDSHITFDDVPDKVIDDIVDNHLHEYKFSLKV